MSSPQLAQTLVFGSATEGDILKLFGTTFTVIKISCDMALAINDNILRKLMPVPEWTPVYILATRSDVLKYVVSLNG